MADYEFGSPEFDEAVARATHEAYLESLATGLPVFVIDEHGQNVMRFADGRTFEIRWIPGAPSGQNYEIVRELTASAA